MWLAASGGYCSFSIVVPFPFVGTSFLALSASSWWLYVSDHAPLSNHLLDFIDLHGPLEVLNAAPVAIGSLKSCIPVLLTCDASLHASNSTLHILKARALAVKVHELLVLLLLSELDWHVDGTIRFVESSSNAVSDVTAGSIKSDGSRLWLCLRNVIAGRDIHHANSSDSHRGQVPSGDPSKLGNGLAGCCEFLSCDIADGNGIAGSCGCGEESLAEKWCESGEGHCG